MVEQAFREARHKDCEHWEEENIPYTMRKKRQLFFKGKKSQKVGIF